MSVRSERTGRSSWANPLHPRLVRLVGALGSLRDQAVQPGALEQLEPAARSRSRVFGVRCTGGKPDPAPARGRRAAPRRSGRVVRVAEREQVEGDEAGRRPLGEELDPAGRRVKTLLELPALLVRVGDRDLAWTTQRAVGSLALGWLILGAADPESKGVLERRHGSCAPTSSPSYFASPEQHKSELDTWNEPAVCAASGFDRRVTGSVARAEGAAPNPASAPDCPPEGQRPARPGSQPPPEYPTPPPRDGAASVASSAVCARHDQRAGSDSHLLMAQPQARAAARW